MHRINLTLIALSLSLIVIVGCSGQGEETTAQNENEAVAGEGQAPTAAELAAAREAMGAQSSGDHAHDHMHTGADGSLPPGHPPLDEQAGGDAPSMGNMAAHGGMPQRPGAPVAFEAPASWTQQPVPPQGMRAAEFQLPAPSEDLEPGEMAVFYFGPAAGGNLDSNIMRWRSQFQTADGQPLPDEAVATERKEVNGVSVITVDIKGTYQPTGMMFGGPAPDPKPNQRMLGALVPTDQGLAVFKAVGPQETMTAHEGAFEEFVQSLKPASGGDAAP